MGQNGSNENLSESDPTLMSAENVSRLPSAQPTELNGNPSPFYPKLARTDTIDTTVAQAGSPARSLVDDGPRKNGNPDTSGSSANTSFPLSDSALPTNFDTSDGDLAADQLSRYFPLPPTKIDSSPNSPLHTSYKTPLSALTESMEQSSLQGGLDAIWAPPKHVAVRISAPSSPAIPGKVLEEPLIDLACEGTDTIMPASSTVVGLDSSLLEPSFEVSLSSSNRSGFNIERMGGAQIRREETLIQMVASHPQLELDLELLDLPPKKAQHDMSTSLIRNETGELIQIPPVTYADAANIASKFPELAEKVLTEPLATPATAARELQPEPEEEASQASVSSQEKVEPEAVMPPHTPDRPNWALAPDDPVPSPASGYNDRPRRGPGSKRRQYSGYAQGQQELDEMWQHGRRGDQRSDQRGGYEDRVREDYRNARNGPACRGWSQDQNFPSEKGHDLPPHLADGARRETSNHADGFPANAAPSGDEWTPAHDAWGAQQSIETQQQQDGRGHDDWTGSGPAQHAEANHQQSNGGGADEWTPKHDGWAAPGSDQRQGSHVDESVPNWGARSDLTVAQPQGHQSNEWAPKHDGWVHQSVDEPMPTRQEHRVDELAPNQDGWSAPTAHQERRLDDWTPTHDPWITPTEQPQPRNEGRARPPRDGFDAPAERREESKAATPSNANEWVTNHDPWTVGCDENHGRQSRMLEPENKHEAPSHMRSSSPFRDRMNDNMNQNDGSKNDGVFAGDVLCVRTPAQSSIASLAASRAGQGDHHDAGERVPTEFDYFSHSNAMDWTNSAPTKPGENSLSPSQRLVSPARASQHDNDVYDQQRSANNSYNQPDNSYSSNSYRYDDSFAGPEANFMLGKMKSDRFDSRRNDSYRRVGPMQWGPPGPDRDRDQGYRGGGQGRDYGSLNYDGGRGQDCDILRSGQGYDSSPGYGREQRGSGNDSYERGSPYGKRGRPLPSQAEEYRNYREANGIADPRFGRNTSSFGGRNYM